MGPPLIAAEDTTPVRLPRSPARSCFNGAAAHRGGRRAHSHAGRVLDARRFNGAAAHRGGRHRPAADVSASSMDRASMGPPLIAAEDPAVPLAGDRDRRPMRFNGAAAHRGGRRARGPGGSTQRRSGFNGAAAHRGGRPSLASSTERATGSASMGPPLIAAEDAAGGSSRRWGPTCFNGAAAHRGGRPDARRGCPRAPGANRASMGPPLIAAEDPQRRTRPSIATSRASMGPPLIAAEDASVRLTGQRLGVALQWGRRSSRRKTLHRFRVRIERGARFNGAAAHRGGRRVASVTRASVVSTASMGPPLIAAEDAGACTGPEATVMLQWGRRSSRRKTRQRPEWRHGEIGHASMGPPLIAAEDVMAAALVSRWGSPAASMGPPLIAAEDEALPLPPSPPVGPLQWGRRSSRRKTCHSRRHRSSQGSSASMGPPLIAAEDSPYPPLATERPLPQLQWGRRSSRRKTRGEPRDDLRQMRLQWGRRSSRRKTRVMVVLLTACVALQWGRRSSRRKTRSRRPSRAPTSPSFNGAAAHRGGRRASCSADTDERPPPASMGPPLIAAEDTSPAFEPPAATCFNGAAAHRGGRPL